MDIKMLTKKSFQINGKKESVLYNPTEEIVKKANSRILLYSALLENKLLTDNAKVAVVGPGEYEVGGVEIFGIADGGEGVIYNVVIDGVTVMVMGSVKQELNEKKMEKIGSADVLMLDLNGSAKESNKIALSMAKKVGANYIVPFGLDRTDPMMLDLLDQADSEGKEPVASLKIDKDNLPDGIEVVLLND